MRKRTALLFILTLLAIVSFFVFFFVKSQFGKVTAVVGDVKTFANKSEPWLITASDKQNNQFAIWAFGGFLTGPKKCLQIPKVKKGQKIEFYLPKMELEDLAGYGNDTDVCFSQIDPSAAFYFLKVVN